jgi:hypothetical protein
MLGEENRGSPGEFFPSQKAAIKKMIPYPLGHVDYNHKSVIAAALNVSK